MANQTPKLSNLEKIERIENAVISIADIVSETIMTQLETIGTPENAIPAYRLPGMLLDTLTLWEKLDKIKTSEMKRGEVDKPVITGALSGVPTSVLLSFIEVENTEDLLSFMKVNSTPVEDPEADDQSLEEN